MPGANTKEFTDANFDKEVLQASQPVLVDFWAEWCMPCRAIAPTIEELAEEYQGKAVVGKLDTDTNRNTAAKYEVSAIPTIILFIKGQAAKKFVGLQSKKEFKAALDEAISG
jgi:thioredoxin 1